MKARSALLISLSLCLAALAHGAGYPAPTERDLVLRDFRFESGEVLPELKLHYRTLGSPARDETGRVRNAVLILHGTGGSGRNFLTEAFAGELFGPGQPLDAARYYLVLPDAIGAGDSSKPSDGLRARFPRYCYHDMVRAQHLLTEGLGVNHLRLVMGTSMGGMHTWLWGQTYPDFMDALMPLASLPVEIAGRNRMMRRMILDAIRTDPDWKDGNYERQPRGLAGAIHVLLLMTSSPLQWQKEHPTRDAADDFLKQQVETRLSRTDANDMLYQFDASRDYDPAPKLAEIRAPLLAINSADDAVNPPELGILQREIRRVPRGRHVILPVSDRTRGHGTHSLPALWKEHLARLLEETGGKTAAAPAAADAPAFGSRTTGLEALERELIEAIVRRDMAAYDRIVADDYVAFEASGKTSGKAEIMDSYRTGTRRYTRLQILDVEVRVFGDTAVVSARTEGSRREGDREVPNRVRYIRVYCRRGGIWRAVAQMAAPMPSP